TRWISCRPNYILPVPVLRLLFRRLFLNYLEQAFDAEELQFFSSLEPLRTRHAFLRHIAPTRKINWKVYAKPPFGGPEQVLKYVARYTPSGCDLERSAGRGRRRDGFGSAGRL